MLLALLYAFEASIKGVNTHVMPSSNIKPMGVFDPVKDFYNKRVVEAALAAVQPTLKKLVKDGITDYEYEAATKAPQWLKQTLQEVLDLDPSKPMKDYGIFNPLYKILYQYFQPIVNKWTIAVKQELNVTISRFESNLNVEINKKVRDTLYWRRLTKRDNWYHNEIEKIIKMISSIVDSAVLDTAIQSRDDYGNRIGQHAKDIINWFLPNDLKIDNLALSTIELPDSNPDSLAQLQRIRDYLKNKLKQLVIALQQRVVSFVQVEFNRLATLIDTKIEDAIRQKCKQVLPFY